MLDGVNMNAFPSDDIQDQLDLLEKIAPEVAVGFRPEGEDLWAIVYIYNKPIPFARGARDLISISRQLMPPSLEGIVSWVKTFVSAFAN